MHATVRASARPQNAVNITYFPKNDENTHQKKIKYIFLHFFYIVKKTLISWYLQRFVAVHCSMHCAKHAVCAILLLEAWRHSLCLWVAAVKMKVCLDWGFGTCKRELVQACVCTAINPNKLILCFFVCWVAALKVRVCLD